MSDPLFQVDETGEDVTRADEATSSSAQLSPAEKAATREEHLRLAEGALVRADDLVAGYVPGVNILRGCDFYLQDRELVGIIGPNGAGKSTLLKALFGLIPVLSGTVSLLGDDITSPTAHARLAHRLAAGRGPHVRPRAPARLPRPRLRPAEQQRVPLAGHRGEHADGRLPQ